MGHWKLLSTIICCNEVGGSRCIKAWLAPLLNRTPFAPIFIAFLDQASRLPPEIQKAVFDSFTPCFYVLWPLAKHKIGVETLLECFSATLKIICLGASQKFVQLHSAVCSAVADAYLSALTRTSNRKKVGRKCSHQILFNNTISPSSLPPSCRVIWSSGSVAFPFSAGLDIVFSTSLG